MTALHKTDDCNMCHASIPWEWIDAVMLGGKALSGTGIWRSQTVDGVCATCLGAKETQRQREIRATQMRQNLLELLGGPKPYREFTFDRFRVEPGNRLAFERATHFEPYTESLYLWGPCGVGKTHLAWAIARGCCEKSIPVQIVRAAQLSRKVRMKDPDQEQSTVDQFVNAGVLIFDDIGNGTESAFSKQILQEILDARDFKDSAGLIVTSQYSLDALVMRFATDSISSRLFGMCRVIEVNSSDRRLSKGGVSKGGIQ